MRLGLKVRKNTIIRRWSSRVQRKQPRDRESVEGKCRTRKSLPVLRASVQRHANLFLHRIPPCIFIIDFASTAGTRVKEGTDNRERDDEARHADRCAGALTSDSVAQLSSVDGATDKHELLLFRVRRSIDKPVGLNQNEQAKQSLQSPVSRLARRSLSANVSSLKRLRFRAIRSVYANDRLPLRMGFHSFHYTDPILFNEICNNRSKTNEAVYLYVSACRSKAKFINVIEINFLRSKKNWALIIHVGVKVEKCSENTFKRCSFPSK